MIIIDPQTSAGLCRKNGLSFLCLIDREEDPMEHSDLFRKESMDRIQSPEQLNDYLRVTNPAMWVVLAAVIILLVGVVLLLYALWKTITDKGYVAGIWPAGIGVVLVVLCLLLCAGWNNTAYYPSNVDLQSSLTLANSCSSEFTLRTMTYVSFLIPFVLAYIVYAWWSIDKKKIDRKEMENDDHIY